MSAGRIVFRVLPVAPTDETPDRWKVTRSLIGRPAAALKRPLGTFRWKFAAVLFARRHALHVFGAGGQSQVVIHGEDGRVKTEWTYRDDPPRSRG